MTDGKRDGKPKKPVSFTRGPWQKRGIMGVMGPDGTAFDGRGRRTICMMIGAEDEESKANFTLVVAAPEVYAEMKALRDGLVSEVGDCYERDCDCTRCAARALIRRIEPPLPEPEEESEGQA